MTTIPIPAFVAMGLIETFIVIDYDTDNAINIDLGEIMNFVTLLYDSWCQCRLV